MYHQFPTEIDDEYNPGLPNDYEELCVERVVAIRNKEIQEKLARQLKEQEDAVRVRWEARFAACCWWN